MAKLKNWILQNKFASLLLLIMVFLVAKSHFGVFMSSTRIGYDTSDMAMESAGYGSPVQPFLGTSGTLSGTLPRTAPLRGEGATPQLNIEDRMMVTTSQVSLLVRNVREAADGIQNKATELGGYVTNTNVHSPTEGGRGSVTLRVPTENREEMLAYLRDFGIRVVSENIDSTDITDEYVDIEGRLATLNTTKARYEQIMESATDVNEILRVQQHIFQVQDEIDRLIGRQNYLQATSQSTLITVYLSTDELALPYSPEDPWRPEVIFKLAVRALLGTLQSVGSAIIWIGVFSVLWLPLIAVYFIIRRYRRNRI